MKVEVRVGGLLEEQVDVLICSANVWLNMSGGVNGAIRERGGEAIQTELHAYLSALGVRHVPPGTVVRTGPGPLSVGAILHAVAVDGFYGSGPELVGRALGAAFAEAQALGAETVALPALATGYGPLSAAQFAAGLRTALDAGPWPFDEVRVVLWRHGDAEVVRSALEDAGRG